MRLVRALRNMLREAARNPLWAIISLALAPFRAGMWLLWATLTAVVVWGVFGLTAEFTLWYFDFTKADLLYRLVMYANAGIALAVLAGLTVVPLLARFASYGDEPTHGSARFATPAETRPLTQRAGLLIGRDLKSGRALRYAGPAHLLTIAPTRTGKGVGTIIPNLLTYPGPVVCIDPKGENARVTARRRARFGPVHVLDPFGVTGLPSGAFNPLDRIEPHGMDFADDTMTLADALVFDPPGEGGDAHWNEEAKALINGLLMHTVIAGSAGSASLATLREALTLPPAAFADLLATMQAEGGLVARAANRHLGKSDREASGVLSAAQRHTHFLDSPRMTTVLGQSDFAFADMKRASVTLYLVLPPDRIASYARWLRLMVAQALTDLARAPSQPTSPILFLLDEFAALGRLDPVERAMGLMAGYGIQLWPILQDVHQLRALYDRRAGTFLSNAGVLQVFGVNDHDSAEMVSDLLGEGTVVFQTMSRALYAKATGMSYASQHVGRSLLTPDEVRTLPSDRELLFLAGQRPIVASKLRYYADREFAGLYDPA